MIEALLLVIDGLDELPEEQQSTDSEAPPNSILFLKLQLLPSVIR